VHGIAHVTGGAFYEMLTKILRPGICFEVRRLSWPVLEIFQKIQNRGKISDPEMFRTFNMGIGMVLVASPKDVKGIQAVLKKFKVENFVIGKVVTDRSAKVKFVV
jgi:phosphoribosylformylglycinamidine cyclo-ligase